MGMDLFLLSVDSFYERQIILHLSPGYLSKVIQPHVIIVGDVWYPGPWEGSGQ